ncbi:head-tail joining protein [Enterococcus phage heks]|nr:putative head-tail joining protein [Enterococcus phage Nonaheksakonda]QIQ66128.1 head-tail joining protein [Enterococcus phage heks]
MSKTNYTDFSEVYNALNAIGKNADRITVKALNQAGEIAKKELAKRSPYFDGKKYAGKMQSYKKEHMKDHTVASRASKNKFEVEVGYDSDVSWRIHFTELGTIRQRPQHFIEKTIKDIEDEVQQIILKAMKEVFLK